jgi:O-antigen ligase
MPHNQFLWILSSTGVLGLLFFVLAWLLPLWSNRNKLNLIVILFHSIMAISFMVEYTLEEQVGGTFFMIFSMFFLKQMSSYK